jgi:colicin import membrane protein
MPPQKPRKTGRARAIALSVLLHSAIVVAAVYGWFTWKHEPPPPETLAVEGSVVDERALNLKPIPDAPPEPEPEPISEPVPEPVPEPEPEPTPAEPETAPEPDAAEVERQKQEEQERLDAEKREQERLEAEKQEQQRLEAEKQEAERLEAEKLAAAKAAAEKAAAERAAAEKKALEKKRAEEAAAAKKAAEEKARLAREAELRRSLEAEERRNAMRNSPQAASWHAQIIARITRAWIRPPSARAGIECKVAVSQVPGGDVTSVRVLSCSIPDPALRESVEAAVYRASPLPPPPDPALFERNLELTFAPQD